MATLTATQQQTVGGTVCQISHFMRIWNTQNSCIERMAQKQTLTTAENNSCMNHLWGWVNALYGVTGTTADGTAIKTYLQTFYTNYVTNSTTPMYK